MRRFAAYGLAAVVGGFVEWVLHPGIGAVGAVIVGSLTGGVIGGGLLFAWREDRDQVKDD